MKRATVISNCGGMDDVISIHALVKRATFADMSKKRYKRYFNPRPREEGDKYRKPFDKRVTISIHALVKRATKTDKSRDTPYNISIHALVKRATR